MSTTYTENLRLAVDSILSATAKANLAKIDRLGSVFIQDADGNTLVRGIEAVKLLPNNSSIGGTGSGGSIELGSASQPLDTFTVFGAISTTEGVALVDQANSLYKLTVLYNSAALGSADTASRTMSIDVQGANRNLVLGTDLSTAAGSLSLGAVVYTLPSTSSVLVDTDDTQSLSNKTLVSPTISSPTFSGSSSGTLTLNGATIVSPVLSGITTGSVTLTGASISGDANTLTNVGIGALKTVFGNANQVIVHNGVGTPVSALLVDSNVSPSAAIAYSKLTLTASLVNADVSPSAAIAKSKLALSDSITNVDINSGAAIAYSKLSLTGGILNGDINASAAIAGTKIAPDFGSQAVRTTGAVQIARNNSIASNFSASASQAADISYTLPATAPSNGQVLVSNGSAVLSWASVGSGTVTSVSASLDAATDAVLSLAGSPITASGTLAFTLDTQVANKVLAGPTAGADAQPTFRTLVSDDIPSLTASKISDFDTSWDTRLGTKDTDDLAEGVSNLYYTDSRVDTRLATYKVVATWAPGDGASKTVTHSMGSTDISINLYDIDSGDEIWVDSINRPNVNNVTLTASSTPTGSGWRVIVRK